MENLPDDHFVKAAQFVKTTYRDVYPAIDPSAADNSQNGKVIVITGANRGLGRRSFVPSFAKSGPKGIVIVARSVEPLAAIAKEIYDINPEIKVLAVSADQTNPESVKSLWDKVEEAFGHADVLINNAGVLHGGMVSEISSTIWWNDFEVNALGQFLQIQGFLKLLGEENKGTIINLTSPAALQVVPTVSSYSLSKMVALQLAAFVAAENPNVTALSLNPGLILSDMTIESYKPFSKDTPELAGGLAVWLSTEKATFLNGKYVDANWSVDELVARKSEIVSEGKLSFALKGEYGSHHFE